MASALSVKVRDWQSQAGHKFLLLLARVVHRLPLGLALGLGRGLGALAPRLSRRHLHLISADIARALQLDASSAMVRTLAINSYRRLGESLIEFFRLPYMTREEILQWATLEGTEHITAALARGHGVILLTAHLGNWELCGALMGLSGYPTTAIARPQENTAITDLFNRIRETHGLKVVPISDVRECVRVLKRNECLGILGDLNASPPGAFAFVQVFGRPAATYLGTAYLALLTGAEIIPIFDERLPDHTHRVQIGAPILCSRTGDRQRDLLTTTVRTQEIIEREVRRRPTEWFWLLKRWETRPECVEHAERIPMEHRDLTPEEARACRTWDQHDGRTQSAVGSPRSAATH
jgi:KDO2-lipid IV(A) lauroyltransferase